MLRTLAEDATGTSATRRPAASACWPDPDDAPPLLTLVRDVEPVVAADGARPRWSAQAAGRHAGMSRFEAAEWKLLADLIQERFGLTFDGVRLRDPRSRGLIPGCVSCISSPSATITSTSGSIPERDSEFDRLRHSSPTTRPTSSARRTSSISWCTTSCPSVARCRRGGRSGSSPPAAPPARSLTRWPSRSRTPVSSSPAGVGDRRLRPERRADRPGQGGGVRGGIAPRLRRRDQAAVLLPGGRALPAAGPLPRRASASSRRTCCPPGSPSSGAPTTPCSVATS